MLICCDGEGLHTQVNPDPSPVPAGRVAADVVEIGGDTGDRDDPTTVLEAERRRVGVEPT